MSSLPVLVLNSGSSSIKFSVYEAGNGARTKLHRRRGRWHRHRSGQVLDQGCERQEAGGSDAGAAHARRRLQAGCRRAALRRLPCPRGHRPSHGFRRPHGAGEPAHHSRIDRRDGTLHGFRAAAHAHRRLHHARGAAALSRHSQLRRPRYLLPSHHAGSRHAHADPGGVRGDGRAPLWSARHFVRVDRLSVAAQRAGEADRRASRQWRIHLRHPQRQVPRHFDGPDAHRRHHQRHAHRRHRSRRAAVHPAQDCRDRPRAPPQPPTSWKPWPARRPACSA